ncbi:protein white-like [Danaus plexippus]|uniref:protein white-like n=1 Tax=Danaus plexippus TaxID=13037 RepID=UPI002AB01239|nr:protein white-like [Danaus plexippus]
MESESIKSSTRSNVFIAVDNLRVWTPEKKSWWRKEPIKNEVVILNNVSVRIKSGEFVAVIGPSGAGKTTFLVSLAGKCNLPNTGTVTVCGSNVKDLSQGVVEVLPQFDVFMDSLSVKEHLIFMIEMKLGSTKKFKNKNVLKTLLHELNLEPLENSSVSSLSGGERRLLSLGTSLISSPQILICDEPTTGLDSYNASLVIGVLKKLSLYGKTVICSVHQPSSDLFREFNSVALMSEGKMLFHGTRNEIKSLFERLNLKCPVNYNPSEFYIKVVCTDSFKNISELMLDRTENDAYYEGNGTTPMISAHVEICQRNWFVQVYLLLWRSSLTLKKGIKEYIVQILITTVISSMILGTCYIGISGTTQQGVQDLRGFLWLVCSEVSFSVSYCALYAFQNDLTLIKREAGIYKVSAFYVSRLLSTLPRCIIWPVLYVVLATLAVELPNHFLTATKFVLVLIVTAVASSAYGLSMGALFTSSGMMADVMPCVDLPLFLMSGAFLRISSLPHWLYPLKYISHFYYGMDALSNIYWRQIDTIECPLNSTTTCLRSGAAVLMENGYSSDFVLQDTLGIVFITLLWSLLGLFGLKREENKGYAY